MVDFSGRVFPHLGITGPSFGSHDTVGKFHSGAGDTFGIGKVDLQVPISSLFGHNIERDFQYSAFRYFPFDPSEREWIFVGDCEPACSFFIFESNRCGYSCIEIPFPQVAQLRRMAYVVLHVFSNFLTHRNGNMAYPYIFFPDAVWYPQISVGRRPVTRLDTTCILRPETFVIAAVTHRGDNPVYEIQCRILQSVVT